MAANGSFLLTQVPPQGDFAGTRCIFYFNSPNWGILPVNPYGPFNLFLLKLQNTIYTMIKSIIKFSLLRLCKNITMLFDYLLNILTEYLN